MILPCLEVVDILEKGKGILSIINLAANTIVEVSPVIVMSAAERILLDQTLLHDYIFIWGEKEDQCCMAQGYISVYNHSYKSNCEYFMDYSNKTMTIKTVIDIPAGTELTLNYNGDWDNDKKIWFNVK